MPPYSQTQSKALFAKAKNLLPGGVNSPVRAYKAVSGTPPFITHGKGSRIWDVDDNEYIDYVGSWGPLILGHSNPVVLEAIIEAAQLGTSFGAPTEREIYAAQLVCDMHPACDMVRFVNSGTEATMSAARLTRGVTGRPKLIKFAGCYHGHGDSFLISAGSGALTFGVPSSPGVTKNTASDTVICTFNDPDSVKNAFDANQGEVAALIVEPVVGNCGCIPPRDGFLSFLREICTTEKTLLIFDEVMTGFRIAKGGAAERYNVQPDLVTLGKVIGGGLPVGAYGGPREIMEQISPVGPIYQAGTLSGNPLAMAAGIAALEQLCADGIYEELEKKSAKLANGIKNVIGQLGVNFTQTRVGSMFSLFFSTEEARNDSISQKCDLELFNAYFWGMLKRGIYLAPSQFEAGFLSLAHTDDDIDRTIQVTEEVLKELL